MTTKDRSEKLDADRLVSRSKMTRRDLMIGGAALASSIGLPLRATAASNALHVAQLKFGSVSWLLKTVVDNKLAEKAGVDLKITNVPINSAGQIGLMSKSFDMVVSDWPWAMVQRSRGLPMKFAPYSSALGALMVPKDSPVKTLADLEGKKIGVAGSAIDKSWLLLRAYARKTLGKDLKDIVTPVFGAPPLIQQQLRVGRVDAALNFWTFSAKLSGSGYQTVLTVADLLKELGIEPPPPLVGFVWNQDVVSGREQAIEKFFGAIKDANGLLASNDEVWENIRPKMRAKTEGEFDALKAYYRAGIPNGWSADETVSAEKLLNLLAELGDRRLSDKKTKFYSDLFYGA